MRHLLKPIQKTMVVITGIKTAIKIGLRALPYALRAGKVGYSAAKATKHGASWIRRHPKAVKYGTVAAGGATLLLDLTNIDYSAIPPYEKPGKIGQTRSYMEQSSSRPRYSNVYRTSRKRCPPRRQKRFN